MRNLFYNKGLSFIRRTCSSIAQDIIGHHSRSRKNDAQEFRTGGSLGSLRVVVGSAAPALIRGDLAAPTFLTMNFYLGIAKALFPSLMPYA